MGVELTPSSSPLPGSGLIGAPPPGTLPDVGFLNDINAEIGDKGFLVTSTEELFQWARTGSL